MSKLIFAGSAALALSSAVLTSVSPASATSGCPTGATLISDGVCEVSFTDGTTYTPPAGITKLDALVVGAGGAGKATTQWSDTYGGGGGDVKLVSLATTGAVTVSVGSPGVGGTPYSNANASSVTQASVTTTAEGGRNAGDTGPSGDSGTGITGSYGYCSNMLCGAGGSGAGGATGTGSNSASAPGGPGIVVNTLTGADTTLFSADTTCYGGGGSTSSIVLSNGVWSHLNAPSVCGGGTGSFTVANDGSYSSYTETEPRENSGSGGGAVNYHNYTDTNLSIQVNQHGAGGYVALRFSGDYGPLPNTGQSSSVSILSAGLAGAGIVAGAFMIVMGARRRKA